MKEDNPKVRAAILLLLDAAYELTKEQIVEGVQYNLKFVNEQQVLKNIAALEQLRWIYKTHPTQSNSPLRRRTAAQRQQLIDEQIGLQKTINI